MSMLKYVLIIAFISNFAYSQEMNESNLNITSGTHSWEEMWNRIGSSDHESAGPLITGVNLIEILNFELPDYYMEPNLPLRIYSSGVQYLFKRKYHEMDKSPPSGLSLHIGIFENREKAIIALGQQVTNVSGALYPLKELGDKAYYNMDASNQWTNFIFRRKNVVIHFGISLPSEQAIAFAKKIDNYLEQDTRFVTRGEKVVVPQLIMKAVPEHIKRKQLTNIDFELVDVDPNEALITSDQLLPESSHGKLIPQREKARTMTYFAPIEKEEAGWQKVTVYVANRQNVFSENEFLINVEDANDGN